MNIILALIVLLAAASAYGQSPAPKYSLAIRNAQSNVIEAQVGPAPILRLCGGGVPASTAAQDGGTSFVEMTLPVDWATAAIDGTISKTSGDWGGVARISGQPTHFRIYKADGVTTQIQGTFSSDTGAGVIRGPDPVAGRLFRINTFTIASSSLATTGINKLRYSTGIQNASLNTIETIVGPSAVFKLLTDPRPATADISDTGTVLATMQLPSDYLSPAANGAIAQVGLWKDPAADATGAMAYGRLYSSGGTPHVQFDITAPGGGGALTTTSVTINPGDTAEVRIPVLQAGNR